jgi:hypothetical protein
MTKGHNIQMQAEVIAASSKSVYNDIKKSEFFNKKVKKKDSIKKEIERKDKLYNDTNKKKKMYDSLKFVPSPSN